MNARTQTTRATRLSRAVALLVFTGLGLAACSEPEFILPGERFDTRVPLAATLGGGPVALPGDGSADAARAIGLPGAQTLGTWGQRGYDAQNEIPHVTLAAQPQLIWSADIGNGNARRFRITADPVAADGRVFTLDSRAGLVATSLQSGAALWSISLEPEFDRGGAISGGGLAYGGGRLFATTGFGELVAIDPASGAVQWRQRLGAGIGAPTVVGGDVYVVSRDNRAWSIAADTGRLQWELPAVGSGAVLAGGAAPAISGGTVIFPFGSGELVGVTRASGVRSWGTVVAGGRLGVAYSSISDITGDPVVVGGTVYAGNQSGRVVALNASTGARRWTASEGSYSPVLVAGGNLFFVSDRNELIRLDASDGSRVWGTELPLYVADRERRRRAVFTHYGPILAGGRVLVASGDRQVRLFSPESGQLVGTVGLRDGAAAHPIVVNNILLVVTEDGRLSAYR